MNQINEQLKGLKLYGMAAVVNELLAQKKMPSLLSALPKMIEVEQAEREVRRIQYQMSAPKFPHHKDFASFDYAVSAIDQTIIEPLCTGQFAQQAHNLILVGGTGTGKTHTAIALGAQLMQRGMKTHFFNAVDLIKEQTGQRQGSLVRRLQLVDCVIIDELGYIPDSKIRRSYLVPPHQ